MNLIPSIDVFKDFSNAVPYRAITNDCIVSVNPDRLTAILEIHVSSLNDVETMDTAHNRLMTLLCELPGNAIVSIYYVKTFHKPSIPVIKGHANDIVNYLEEIRVNHLSGITSYLHQNYLSITLPLDNEKSEFALIDKMFSKDQSGGMTEIDKLGESFKKTLDKLNYFTKSLIAGIDGTIYRLSSSQILQFLSLLCNHDFVEHYSGMSSIFKGDFNASIGGLFNTKTPGYVYYGGKYHAVMSMRSIDKKSKLPDKSHAGLNRIFLHKDLKDTPFIVQHSIAFVSKSEGIRKAELRKNMITSRGAIAKYLPFLAKTPEGINPEILRVLIEQAIEIVKNSNKRFLEQHFHVHLWADSLRDLEETARSFDATVSSVYKLKRDKYNIKAAFYSLFPGNESLNPIRNMLPSFNVSDFMPIDMPRFCYPHKKSKQFIYYHNSVDALNRIDPFDRRSDAWNALIIGGSGSGKSFLAQDILWQFMPYNPQIAIIDRGGAESGSYRSFVMNNKGTYLEIAFESKVQFSINPFDGKLFDENGSPYAFKMISLLATIERMVCEENTKELSGNVKYEVQRLLKEYYTAKNNNEKNDCNLHEFAFEYLKGNQPLIAAGRDLWKELFYFIGRGKEEGPYARFFRQTQEIQNKDIICFDLQGLSGHPKLKDVLVPALLDMIANNILGIGGADRRRFVFVDEAWADLKGGSNVGAFMEELSRTIRKLNGQITIISQRFSDILDSPIGGALVANTSYYYLVGSKHEGKPLEKAVASSSEGRRALSNFDIDQILTQRSKRDFYLLTPFFCGQLRLYPSKEFCMVATTDPNDKAILRKHQNLLGAQYVTPEVMESAKEEFFRK